MSTRTVIPFSPPPDSHRSEDASVMLAPQSGCVPARASSSPGYPKEGLLENELRVEVGLVRESCAGLLDRPERARRSRGVAPLLQIDVDPKRGIASGRPDDPIPQDRGRCEEDPVDEVALGPAFLAVMPFFQTTRDPPVGVLDATPIVGELGELLVEGLLQTLAVRGA